MMIRNIARILSLSQKFSTWHICVSVPACVCMHASVCVCGGGGRGWGGYRCLNNLGYLHPSKLYKIPCTAVRLNECRTAKISAGPAGG